MGWVRDGSRLGSGEEEVWVRTWVPSGHEGLWIRCEEVGLAWSGVFKGRDTGMGWGTGWILLWVWEHKEK